MEAVTPVSEQDPTGRHAPSDTGASLLADLSDDTQAALLAAATRVHVPAGEWLFRLGDPADAMYVLESGRVEVLGGEEPRSGGGAVLRVLGPGSSLGEVAVLTRSTRSASARTRRDTVLPTCSVRSRSDRGADPPVLLRQRGSRAGRNRRPSAGVPVEGAPGERVDPRPAAPPWLSVTNCSSTAAS